VNTRITFTERQKLLDLSDLGISWSNSHIQGPNSVDMGDRIRVYFTSRNYLEDRPPTSHPGFFDLSKANLTEILDVSPSPILELGRSGCFDEFGIYPVSVIKISEGNFFMTYGGWSRPKSVRFDVAIGLARSQNGKEFEKLFPGPVLGRDQKEPFVLSSPKLRYFNGRYYLFYISGDSWSTGPDRMEPNYRIRVATSKDLVLWDRVYKNLVPRLHPFESQASPDVFFHNDKYHMFFCFRDARNYFSGRGAYRIGYAFSEDLISWNRPSVEIDLPPSKMGWDSEMVSYPHIIQFDGNLWMFYSGNGVGATGVGLARINDDSLA
jgi:hypothetical protein